MKKTFQLRSFVFLSICDLVSLLKGQICHYWCQGKVSKGFVVTKYFVSKEFVMIFYKKSKLILVDLTHSLDICRSHWLFLDK